MKGFREKHEECSDGACRWCAIEDAQKSVQKARADWLATPWHELPAELKARRRPPLRVIEGGKK